MRQLLHSMRDGAARLTDVPLPAASGPMLVVESRATVISVGTERAVVEFARAGWIDRVRAQPDKVLRVLDKMRTEGIGPTLQNIRSHLDTPFPLGYCQAGVVHEIGAGVRGFAPGDRVVTNGPHAEFVRVPHTLAARIPDGVDFETAAFTPLVAIGLQGVRLAQPTLGETFVVYGLGLIGLLTVQVLRAAGCRVVGVDRAADRCAIAERLGARVVRADEGVDVAAQVMTLTGGIGADAVLLTVATDSDEPVRAAATMSRKRGRIVLVGVSGLNLRRADFYEKELSFQVSCSYGPGRYDPEHESKGLDYPLPFVRWTEARNFEAVLELMRTGAVDPRPLISHRFAIEQAEQAYQTITSGAPALGVVLEYPPSTVESRSRTVQLRAPAVAGRASVGWIGAGNFSTKVLVPAFAKADARLTALASQGGSSAAIGGSQHGFERVTTDADALLDATDIDTIVVATRHSSHASWTRRALAAGKHVFVEKPLALASADLDALEQELANARGVLCAGFNRRMAPDIVSARKILATRSGPLAVVMIVNAGAIPRSHWTQDYEVGGGRIVGECCHFIDLARALVGSSVSTLQVITALDKTGSPLDDIAALQLGFEDGSIASIQYVANGHKQFPKERVEMFFDGRVLQIDDFREMRGVGVTLSKRQWRRGQDKGHDALAAAFVGAVRAGAASPIPAAELLEVGRVSIEAAALARAGGGSMRLKDGRPVTS